MKKDNVVVGQKVVLKRQMLGEPVGSIGYVYETYPDFDNANNNGASIIFMNGGYDGFSSDEQDLFLEILEVDARYSCYDFKNVNQVYKDFKNGYWNF